MSNSADTNKIPVHISKYRIATQPIRRLPAVRKTVQRNNIVLQAVGLPTVMNLNPRSIYNKSEEFQLLLDQYDVDVVCMSESWERDSLSLGQLLKLDNYQILSNPKQRNFKGGKPAILVKTEKFNVQPLCPDIITVPVGVETVWALISPKAINSRNRIRNIAVCSLYYRGPKSTKRKELFDHIAESYNLLTAKYGADLHFIIAGDTNRLNLSPILNLSPTLKQVVTVPTRLNPDAILDPIITTLFKLYCEPITKPPINNDEGNGGKPSDHLVVLMLPLSTVLDCPPRQYKTVVCRPLTDSGIHLYGEWLAEQNWNQVYSEVDCHKKAEVFQKLLVEKFHELFPLKSFKVCSEDQPWITRTLKQLDRKRKREFSKNQKSPKWKHLNKLFEDKCKTEKENYYSNIVRDLKTSNPGQWYSKIKRMSGQEVYQADLDTVEELSGLDDDQQVEAIADHYAAISNLYEPVKEEDFKDYLEKNRSQKPPNITPYKVLKTIKKMNKNSSTVPGDLPMRIISLFSDDLALPLSHLIGCSIQNGQYPALWKNEVVTPVPKVFPPEKLEQLRKISGLLNFAKIADKILAEYMVEDMAPHCDKAQYGNEEGLSVQHYLVKMLHQILTNLDNNSQSEAFAVIISMIDWSQAFDRQSHVLGIESFIKNGVRPSLIPVLLNFFQDRTMQVKWNGKLSSSRILPGGGPQGDVLGIIEYKSQSDDNTNFLDDNKKFKYIDDLSILEVINMVLCGISSYNSKQQVPSDIAVSNKFIINENLKTQDYLNQISQWTEQKQMKLNIKKSNYMIFNFTRNFQFNTRLYVSSE